MLGKRRRYIMAEEREYKMTTLVTVTVDEAEDLPGWREYIKAGEEFAKAKKASEDAKEAVRTAALKFFEEKGIVIKGALDFYTENGKDEDGDLTKVVRFVDKAASEKKKKKTFTTGFFTRKGQSAEELKPSKRR